MRKPIKIAFGCALALALATGCGIREEAVREVESTERPVVVETRSYETTAEVVFHEYVPTQYRVHAYRGGNFEYTTWTPTIIVECNGMRKRFEDQATYELYFLREELDAVVTDGLDAQGNVISCDFAVIGRARMKGGIE